MGQPRKRKKWIGFYPVAGGGAAGQISGKQETTIMNINRASTWIAAGMAMACLLSAGANGDSPADKGFLLKAIQAGMMEVRLSEMARLKGNRADVRELGLIVVRDNATFNDDLKALAQQKGLPFPYSLDAKHQAIVTKMVDLTGTQFDMVYIDTMTQDLTTLAKEFADESARTTDPDIKKVVDKSILIINQHLKDVTAMR